MMMMLLLLLLLLFGVVMPQHFVAAVEREMAGADVRDADQSSGGDVVVVQRRHGAAVRRVTVTRATQDAAPEECKAMKREL